MPLDDEQTAGSRNLSSLSTASASSATEEAPLSDSPIDRIRSYLRSGKVPAPDALDDYNSDYRSFSALGGVETADMRHRRLRVRENETGLTDDPCDSLPHGLGPEEAESPSETAEAEVSSERAVPFEAPPGVPGRASPGGLHAVQVIGSRCAHRYAGVEGCRRCIESCEFQAVSSSAAVPQIDCQKCRECGNCAGVCPLGAVRMVTPEAGETENALKTALSRITEDGRAPVAVFRGRGIDIPKPLREAAPNRIDIELEHFGALGMERLMGMLAAGALGIAVCPSEKTTPGTLRLLEQQVHCTRLLIAACGHSPDRVVLMKPGAESFQLPAMPSDTLSAVGSPFSDFELPKRQVLQRAIARLADSSRMERTRVPLPTGAAYGAVAIEENACTLCMACTSLCPTGALSSREEPAPALYFREAGCVQCGLCAAGCPEKALTLRPRMHFGAQVHETSVCLKEDAPFLCIRCGTAFATRHMIETMTARLAGHQMFASEQEKSRLRMCRTCRAKDIFESAYAGDFR